MLQTSSIELIPILTYRQLASQPLISILLLYIFTLLNYFYLILIRIGSCHKQTILPKRLYSLNSVTFIAFLFRTIPLMFQILTLKLYHFMSFQIYVHQNMLQIYSFQFFKHVSIIAQNLLNIITFFFSYFSFYEFSLAFNKF